MSKKKLLCFTVVPVLFAVCLVLTACPTSSGTMDAVNKYLSTLTAVQQGEIVAHNDKEVDDDFHIQFQGYMKVGFQTGGELDSCALVQAQGGDTTSCIDSAQKAFDTISDAVNAKNNAKLQALVSVAGAALKNVLVVIKSIKPQPVKPSPGGGAMAFWFALSGCGLVGIVVNAEEIAGIIKLVADESPVFLTWLTNIIRSNKGKTPEELESMNQALIAQGIATADKEIADTKAKLGQV